MADIKIFVPIDIQAADFNFFFRNLVGNEFDDDANRSIDGVTYDDVYRIIGGSVAVPITLEAAGSGFNEDGTSGTIEYLVEYSESGTFFSFSGISVPLASLTALIESVSTADDVAFLKDAMSGADTIDLSEGADRWNGFRGADTMFGRGGGDFLFGGNGGDTIFGGDGDDRIEGQAGWDRMVGGNGEDTIFGGNGNDTAFGAEGADKVYMGDGADIAYGQNKQDTIFGGDGNDTVYGGNGGDEVYGGANNDLVFGNDGWDKLALGNGADAGYGGNGNDTIFGSGGNDTVFGGAGNDILAGGDGADTVTGAGGDDTMWGGNGTDVFVFRQNFGDDVIGDFDTTADILRLSSDIFSETPASLEAFADTSTSDLILEFSETERLVLRNVETAEDLSFEIF